jgi:hypothetical protein
MVKVIVQRYSMVKVIVQRYSMVKVIVQRYSMVKVTHAELGDKRNIMMCTEGQGKTKRGRR